MERATNPEVRRAASRALTLFALLIALLFRAFPSAPVAAPARDSIIGPLERAIGTNQEDDGERTEPVAHKPATVARRNGSMEDDDGVGTPAASLASSPTIVPPRIASDANVPARKESNAPRGARHGSPRSSRGPPARG